MNARPRVSAIVTLRLRSGAIVFKLVVAPDRDTLLREARHQGYLVDAVSVAVANAKRVTVYVRDLDGKKLVERVAMPKTVTGAVRRGGVIDHWSTTETKG